MKPVVPPATIGMLGGGQLGRYAVVAARLMGYGTIVVDPDPAAPAGAVADDHLVAAYDDAAVLAHLATRCGVVTVEFENPPASALEQLAATSLVAPPPRAVAIAQNRLTEKQFLVGAGLAVAPFRAVTMDDDDDGGGAAVRAGPAGDVGYPAILKTARLGYDGKGQRVVAGPGDVARAWAELGGVPSVLEQRLELDAELSVLVARTADGRTAVYPVAENHHADGILDLTVVPARVDPELAGQAQALGRHVADALDYVGVLAVEMFVTARGLVVNELAPRPHNSGHWTLDAAVTDQFAQQVRAVCGLALGDTSLTAPAVAMVNLLGDRWSDGEPDWAVVLGDRDARLHLYGKSVARPGRKMGHVTVLAPSSDDAVQRARHLRDGLTRRAGAGGPAPRRHTAREPHGYSPGGAEVPTTRSDGR